MLVRWQVSASDDLEGKVSIVVCTVSIVVCIVSIVVCIVSIVVCIVSIVEGHILEWKGLEGPSGESKTLQMSVLGLPV